MNIILTKLLIINDVNDLRKLRKLFLRVD